MASRGLCLCLALVCFLWMLDSSYTLVQFMYFWLLSLTDYPPVVSVTYEMMKPSALSSKFRLFQGPQSKAHIRSL